MKKLLLIVLAFSNIAGISNSFCPTNITNPLIRRNKQVLPPFDPSGEGIPFEEFDFKNYKLSKEDDHVDSVELYSYKKFGFLRHVDSGTYKKYDHLKKQKYWNTTDEGIDILNYRNDVFKFDNKIDMPVETLYDELVLPNNSTQLTYSKTYSYSYSKLESIEHSERMSKTDTKKLGVNANFIIPIKKFAKLEVGASYENQWTVSNEVYDSFTYKLEENYSSTETITYEAGKGKNDSSENLHFQVNKRQTFDVYVITSIKTTYEVKEEYYRSHFFGSWVEYSYKYDPITYLPDSYGMIFVPNGNPYLSVDRYYRNHTNGDLELYDNYSHNKIYYI